MQLSSKNSVGFSEGSLLATIKGPEDLRRLSRKELTRLAGEIRQELIQVVLENGGHLAPNLGVVELTIALHLSFHTPKDKIIWDVGHQCYVHKLLTGRQFEFQSLRQLGGLGGFPSREESPHDAFGTGHGSTSISAALGLAKARDLMGGEYHVVAVIGDGAMSGGLAFEGLNQAGELKSRLIVVLNDNAMSISPNVGGMSLYLQRMRTDPHYLRLKRDFEQMMHRLPLGERMLERVRRFKDGLKYMLTPGMLFEELGFTYLGPVDGHDINATRAFLELAKRFDGPVLVHVVTKKGKGFQPAEENATKFHGVAGNTRERQKETGKTYTEVFGQTMIELAERDPKLVAITAAMEEGTGLVPFSERFPDRFFDAGMAEGHAATFAAGFAAAGMRPVVAIYSTFLQRAFDQTLHDVCLQKLPVIFALDRAGLVPNDGPTHQGLFDLSYLRQIPNMTIMAPSNEDELRHMLFTATTLGSPAAIRYPKGQASGAALSAEFREIPVGKAEILREGRDLYLIGIGQTVNTCLAAADRLQREGLNCGVVNGRFAKPADKELFCEIGQSVPLLITVEENTIVGGFGAAVIEALQAGGVTDARVECLGVKDTFVPHGDIESLRREIGLDAAGIGKRAAALVKTKISS